MKRFLLIFIMLFSSILLASLAGSYFIQHSESLFSLKQLLKNYYWQMTVWRYTVFALVFWYWPVIFTWIGRRRQWPEKLIHYFIKKRLEAVCLFIFFELLIVHNGLGQVLSFLF